jgi:hypothetical protein
MPSSSRILAGLPNAIAPAGRDLVTTEFAPIGRVTHEAIRHGICHSVPDLIPCNRDLFREAQAQPGPRSDRPALPSRSVSKPAATESPSMQSPTKIRTRH